MKEIITKDLKLKLLSIFFALIIWISIVSISNPEVSRTKAIALEVINEDVLGDAGKTYDLGGVDTVNVVYKVRVRDEYSIKASDLRAYIDLSQLYDVTGSVPVNVEILNNRDLFIEAPAAKPSVVSVHTEDIQKKSFELSTSTTGTPSQGLAVGEIKLSPSSVYVSGPVSTIGRISSVGVEIDVEGASQSMSGKLKPIFFDANGNELDIQDSRLTLDYQEIDYELSMLRGKSLELKFNVAGQVAPGYRFTGAESSTKSILVAGDDDALAGLSSIEIPSSVLDISNATISKTIVLDVGEYLPADVIAKSNTEISVILKVEAEHKKPIVIEIEDIALEAALEEYTYKLSPERITVSVSGLDSDLKNLTKDVLKASLNVKDLTIGNHTIEMKFTLPSGFEVDSYTPFTLRISNKEEESSTESKESTEESGSSAAEESKSKEFESSTAAN